VGEVMMGVGVILGRAGARVAGMEIPSLPPSLPHALSPYRLQQTGPTQQALSRSKPSIIIIIMTSSLPCCVHTPSLPQNPSYLRHRHCSRNPGKLPYSGGGPRKHGGGRGCLAPRLRCIVQ